MKKKWFGFQGVQHVFLLAVDQQAPRRIWINDDQCSSRGIEEIVQLGTKIYQHLHTLFDGRFGRSLEPLGGY